MTKVFTPGQSQSTNQESSHDKTSEISEQKDKDVIRYTLQAYIESYTASSSAEKQQAAVDKINKLTNENFDELVCDIVNEVHRRCKMEHDEKSNPMREKLIKLKEEKFKNLVFDVLKVFNLRYFPESKPDIKEEISKLGKLISILKVEEEAGDDIIKENNEKLKFKHFIEYIKGFHHDKIVDYMEKFVNESIESDYNNSFDIIFNYKILLKKLDSSKYKKLREYKIFKGNIERVEKLNVDKQIKKDLIKKEYLNIIDLILTKQYYFEELCIKNNVNYLLNIINTIDTENEEFEKQFELIKRISFNILTKAKTISYINMDILSQLKRILREKEFVTSKIDLNEFLQKVTLHIRKLIEDITR